MNKSVVLNTFPALWTHPLPSVSELSHLHGTTPPGSPPASLAAIWTLPIHGSVCSGNRSLRLASFLTVVFPRLTCPAAWAPTSFGFMTERCPTGQICHNLLIPSPTDGHWVVHTCCEPVCALRLGVLLSVLWGYNSRMPVILKNLEAFRRGKEGMSDNRVSVMEAGARAGSEHLQERVPSAGWPCQAGTLIIPSQDEVTEAPGILANSPNLSLDSGLTGHAGWWMRSQEVARGVSIETHPSWSHLHWASQVGAHSGEDWVLFCLPISPSPDVYGLASWGQSVLLPPLPAEGPVRQHWLRGWGL